MPLTEPLVLPLPEALRPPLADRDALPVTLGHALTLPERLDEPQELRPNAGEKKNTAEGGRESSRVTCGREGEGGGVALLLLLGG